MPRPLCITHLVDLLLNSKNKSCLNEVICITKQEEDLWCQTLKIDGILKIATIARNGKKTFLLVLFQSHNFSKVIMLGNYLVFQRTLVPIFSNTIIIKTCNFFGYSSTCYVSSYISFSPLPFIKFHFWSKWYLCVGRNGFFGTEHP